MKVKCLKLKKKYRQHEVCNNAIESFNGYVCEVSGNNGIYRWQYSEKMSEGKYRNWSGLVTVCV